MFNLLCYNLDFYLEGDLKSALVKLTLVRLLYVGLGQLSRLQLLDLAGDKPDAAYTSRAQ